MQLLNLYLYNGAAAFFGFIDYGSTTKNLTQNRPFVVMLAPVGFVHIHAGGSANPSLEQWIRQDEKTKGTDANSC